LKTENKNWEAEAMEITSAFFTPSNKLFAASTTSLPPITNAPKVGCKKPRAATGMATTL